MPMEARMAPFHMQTENGHIPDLIFNKSCPKVDYRDADYWGIEGHMPSLIDDKNSPKSRWPRDANLTAFPFKLFLSVKHIPYVLSLRNLAKNMRAQEMFAIRYYYVPW